MNGLVWFSLYLFVKFSHCLYIGKKEQNAFSFENIRGGFFGKLNGANVPSNVVNNYTRHFDHRIFRFSYPFGDGLTEYCKRPAKCVHLNVTTCMGMSLPYSSTSLDLVDGLLSQENALEQLEELKRLIHIPKCWAVVQPFLCALYMPRCEEDMVYLPSQEMCKVTLMPCRIFLESFVTWPFIFKCDNATRYPHMCKNDVREVKFNTSGRCLEPLVQTDLASSYYEGIDGCGLQCDNPMFTHHERDQVHKIIARTATLCFILNLFAIITLRINKRHFRRYPAYAIYKANVCFAAVCFGWLVQFLLPGGREDIVCRKDGTLRTGEPSAGENLSCVAVFVMVYYFLLASIAWFVIFIYAWHFSVQSLGKIKEEVEGKRVQFQLLSWSVPFILTVTSLTMGEIDGDSMTGVCFVGSTPSNRQFRYIFLLVPVLVALLATIYFVAKGLFILIRLKIDSKELISERARSKIKKNILQMSITSVLLFIFGLVTFIYHFYEGWNERQWQESFREYMLCKLGMTDNLGECRMGSRPSLALLQVHILAMFLTGIVMSSWVWSEASTCILSWRRFFKKFLKKDEENVNENPPKVKKHKLIAQAYAKRNKLNADGRLSLSISTDEDPLGLKFELSSGSSESLRSSWAAALPKMVQRRGALITTNNSTSSSRRTSLDSEISYSVRRVSIESRRSSVDSSVSVKVSEVTKTLIKKVKTPHKKNHGRSRRSRINRSNRKQRRQSRQNGNQSSNENKDVEDIALSNVSDFFEVPKKGYGPDLGRRRAANVGLDGDPMALLAEHLLSQKLSSGGSSSAEDSGLLVGSRQDIALDILKDIGKVQR